MSHYSQLFSDNSPIAVALWTFCGREAGMPITALLDRKGDIVLGFKQTMQNS
jgi:hypothetical protein